MLPPVTLHARAMDPRTVSPAVVNPTAMKLVGWFCCSVTVRGDTISRARVAPFGSVVWTARSQAKPTATAHVAAAARRMRSLIIARRADSLCMNVMAVPFLAGCRLQREEFVHIGRPGSGARVARDAQP